MKKNLRQLLPLGLMMMIALSVVSCKKDSGKPNSGSDDDQGTFSATIDGKTIGGTGKNNSAIVIIGADSASSQTLMSDIFVTMQASGDTIGFHIPDQTGITVIGRQSPAQYYGVYSLPGSFYLFDGVSVDVTSMTATRIKGTFAGPMTTSLVEGMGTQTTVTGGTFDLPLLRP